MSSIPLVQRKDTETQVGEGATVTRNTQKVEDQHAEMRDADTVVAIRSKLYEKAGFRTVLTLEMLGLYVMVTLGAVLGVSI